MDIVEEIAEALWADRFPDEPWGSAGVYDKNDYRGHARAALERLSALGQPAGNAFDLTKEPEQPYAFVQWKGTDACMDFHCECGRNQHLHGMFLYEVKCECGLKWEMPSRVFPRKTALV